MCVYSMYTCRMYIHTCMCSCMYVRVAGGEGHQPYGPVGTGTSPLTLQVPAHPHTLPPPHRYVPPDPTYDLDVSVCKRQLRLTPPHSHAAGEVGRASAKRVERVESAKRAPCSRESKAPPPAKRRAAEIPKEPDRAQPVAQSVRSAAALLTVTLVGLAGRAPNLAKRLLDCAAGVDSFPNSLPVRTSRPSGNRVHSSTPV